VRDPLLEVVDEPERRRIERALVIGERLDVPAHRLPEHGLGGGAEAPAEARPQSQRPVGGDGPQALGLGPRGPTVVRLARRAGVGAGTPDLLLERREERVDVDLVRRRKAVVHRLVRHRASVALSFPQAPLPQERNERAGTSRLRQEP
jgi:hypothetical protein